MEKTAVFDPGQSEGTARGGNLPQGSPANPARARDGSAVRAERDTGEVDRRLRAAAAEVLSGQKERFEEIVAIIGPQIHAVAWKLTQNPDDALDVSQEALLRIYRALPAWKGRCRFTTWAHRVVLNTSVDFLRRQSKHYRGRVELPAPSEQDEPYEPQEWEGVTHYTAADAVERSEVRRRILQALELLSGRQRKCFLLRHFQELGVREVAEVLGTTEGTVKRHLFRACRRLRELLGTD